MAASKYCINVKRVLLCLQNITVMDIDIEKSEHCE